MFCVECGREGATTAGLCAACFVRKHRLVDPPPHVDVPRCTACGAFLLGKSWVRTDLERATPRILREAISPRAPFEEVFFTYVAREEDESNYLLTVKASGRHETVEAVQDFPTRLRLKPSLCDLCGKQRSRYYEGIVQVRAEGRNLSSKERRAVRTFVHARADRAREARRDFVSRTEEVSRGLDFYVSTNAFAKEIARELAQTYGGSVTTSSKLFGQRAGRELYRVTALVRLSPFQIGDVVRVKQIVAEVVKVANLITLRDLRSGEERRFRPRDLRGARRVDAERFEATLESVEDGGIVAVHHETGAQRPLVAPRSVRKDRVVVVWTEDAVFLSALPADISKG